MQKLLLTTLTTLLLGLANFIQAQTLDKKNQVEVDSFQQLLHALPEKAATRHIELLEAIAKRYRISDQTKALAYFEQAVLYAQESKDSLKEANLYSEIAQIYTQTAKPYYSIDYLNRATSILKQMADKQKLNYYIYIDIGNVYFAEKIYAGALPYYREALRGFELQKDSNGISLSYRNLGFCYQQNLDIDSALYFLHKSLLYIQPNQVEELGIAYSHLATTYKRKKDYTSAIHWAKKSITLDLSNTTSSGYYAAAAYFNLGLNYELAGILDSAIYSYQQAETIGFNEPVLKISIAAVYVAQGKIQEAKGLLLPFISNSSSFSNLGIHDRRAIHKTYISIYRQEKQWEKALESADAYAKTLWEQLRTKPTQNKLLEFTTATANLQKDFELKRSAREFAHQKQLKETAEAAQSIYLIGMLILIALLAALVLLYLSIQKKNLEVQEKNELIAQKNRQLTAFNQTQTKLFSIIAHDLRTPFSQLIGFSEQMLSKEEQNWERTQQSFQTISQSARQAYFLFEDLLGWARTQSGDLNTQIEQLYLPKLMRKAVAPLQILLESKNLSLTIVNKDSIQWLDSDPYMVQTILRNLISNAIRYSPVGGRISVQLSPSGKQADRVLFSIRDEGPGIAPEAIPFLFDEEKWIHSTTNTGLGLVLCKEFVQAHGGKIEAHNDHGAVFSFDLALARLQTETDRSFTPMSPTKKQPLLWDQTWTALLMDMEPRIKTLEIYDATLINQLVEDIYALNIPYLSTWASKLQEAAFNFEESLFEQLKAEICSHY